MLTAHIGPDDVSYRCQTRAFLQPFTKPGYRVIGSASYNLNGAVRQIDCVTIKFKCIGNTAGAVAEEYALHSPGYPELLTHLSLPGERLSSEGRPG